MPHSVISDVLRRPLLQPRRGRPKPPVSWKRCSTGWPCTWEKTEAIKSKIRSALMYPISVVIVAFVVVTIVMIFVIPAFKEVFTSFGADLLLLPFS